MSSVHGDKGATRLSAVPQTDGPILAPEPDSLILNPTLEPFLDSKT